MQNLIRSKGLGKLTIFGRCKQYTTYKCKTGRGGGGGGGGGAGAWGGDLIIFAFAAPRVGHLNYLTPPGEGIFETFFSRLALGSIKNLRYCGIIVNRHSVFKRENSIRLKTCIKV